MDDYEPKVPFMQEFAPATERMRQLGEENVRALYRGMMEAQLALAVTAEVPFALWNPAVRQYWTERTLERLADLDVPKVEREIATSLVRDGMSLQDALDAAERLAQ